eukprot:TRINITY_DN225_c0_g5_i1.p1 TRINITY_DN225_c0_g5~~TRINITY_DN225_c0_g5_i1.p1  ORF type:complete len:968 (-),score=227.06 TRINITY_DN225_c0_g5_i1:1038-3941(-)
MAVNLFPAGLSVGSASAVSSAELFQAAGSVSVLRFSTAAEDPRPAPLAEANMTGGRRRGRLDCHAVSDSLRPVPSGRLGRVHPVELSSKVGGAGGPTAGPMDSSGKRLGAREKVREFVAKVVPTTVFLSGEGGLLRRPDSGAEAESAAVATGRRAWEEAAHRLKGIRNGRVITTVAAATKVSAGVETVGAGDGPGLRRGMLLEVERDATRRCLAVVQKPDGKRNWITADQNGKEFSIRPQQVTFRVPGPESYNVADIEGFLKQVEGFQDLSLLELAWGELLAEKRAASSQEISELLFMSSGPAECYATFRMLSGDKVYFKTLRKGGQESEILFEARTPAQVEELRAKAAAIEAQQAERQAVVTGIREMIRLNGLGTPVSSDTWRTDALLAPRIEAIKAMALERLDECDPSVKKLAEETLESLQISRLASAASNLLVRMGVFPLHANLALLRSDVPQEFPLEVLAVAKQHLLPRAEEEDVDWFQRVDLTALKVYTIDSDDTTEVDDGLSVERLADGRSKLWIHVADPARLVKPGDLLDCEAQRRGTSVYLCTGKLPMFPWAVAAGPMSLREGQRCAAMSVGVLLHPDGSLAETEIVNSFVQPSHRLTYESAEVLLLEGEGEEREEELELLAEAAYLRQDWRMAQGAVEILLPEPDLKVTNLTSPNPSVTIDVIDQTAPARRLVSEMMVLAGEAVALWGQQRGLPLPYRGQPQPEFPPEEELAALPPGPCRDVQLRKCMPKSETSCTAPSPHASLGLKAYVQFTSPIRRYPDLLAHYQVKAVLRGEAPPFSSAALDSLVVKAGGRMREARRQENLAQRYWLQEFMRRRPRFSVMPALVLRFLKEGDNGLVVVLIHEIGLETVMRCNRTPYVGETLYLVVAEADPKRDVLRLQEASPASVSNFLKAMGQDVPPLDVPSPQIAEAEAPVEILTVLAGAANIEANEIGEQEGGEADRALAAASPFPIPVPRL